MLHAGSRYVVPCQVRRIWLEDAASLPKRLRLTLSAPCSGMAWGAQRGDASPLLVATSPVCGFLAPAAPLGLCFREHQQGCQVGKALALAGVGVLQGGPPCGLTFFANPPQAQQVGQIVRLAGRHSDSLTGT
jgi:hypothetical protein